LQALSLLSKTAKNKELQALTKRRFTYPDKIIIIFLGIANLFINLKHQPNPIFL